MTKRPPEQRPGKDDAEVFRARAAESTSHMEPDDLHFVVHHTALPHTRLSAIIDKGVRKTGEVVSWAWLILVAVIALNVTLRYLFNEGRIEFEEIQWHIYAVCFLFGLSYCLEADDHVRVDLVYENLSAKAQAWIELFGITFFLAPFIVLVLYYAWPFAAYSFSIGEVSDAPAGLPYRWLIKSALFIGFILLALSAFARLLRVMALLTGRTGSGHSPL